MKSSSPADHYLQLDIIRKLYASETPLSFTQLKDDGIENSLFMYHMNKLISRNVVEKNQSGFVLTKAGAYWANNSGLEKLHPSAVPKVLVQLLVFSEEKSEILLSKRKGSVSELINHYILPGKAVETGIPQLERANEYAKSLGIDTTLDYSGVYEFIHQQDGFSYHNIAFVYAVRLSSKIQPIDEEFYDYEWVLAEQLLRSNEDKLLVALLKNYQEKTTVDQLSIVINN